MRRHLTPKKRAELALKARVQLLTAAHPIDPQLRRAGWEYGQPITLADNVWLGGGVIVCPGVTIGQDTMVGTGAVITRDLPSGVVAAGVPARVLREIGDRDRVEIPLARSTEFVTRLWPAAPDLDLADLIGEFYGHSGDTELLGAPYRPRGRSGSASGRFGLLAEMEQG